MEGLKMNIEIALDIVLSNQPASLDTIMEEFIAITGDTSMRAQSEVASVLHYTSKFTKKNKRFSLSSEGVGSLLWHRYTNRIEPFIVQYVFENPGCSTMELTLFLAKKTGWETKDAFSINVPADKQYLNSEYVRFEDEKVYLTNEGYEFIMGLT